LVERWTETDIRSMDWRSLW
jgi:hypothetical protein